MAGNRVYSTESGRICPGCDKALQHCNCRRQPRKASASQDRYANIPQDGVVRLLRDTKGRKGAGATIVHGIQADATELKKIAKALKQLCGSGGAIKEGCIEIQGDQREKIKSWLEARGYTVKLAGG